MCVGVYVCVCVLTYRKLCKQYKKKEEETSK